MAQVATKKNYHVDLADLMRTYETNYAKLNALLPSQPSVGDVRCYQAASMTYQIQVGEVTKYTTLVDICQSDDKVYGMSLGVELRISKNEKMERLLNSMALLLIF